MKKINFFFIVLICVIGVTYIMYPSAIGSVPINILYLIAPLSTVIAGIQLLKEYKISSISKQYHMIFLWLGYGMLGIGNVLWKFLTVADFPSVSDLLFVSSYPFIFFGLYKILVREGGNITEMLKTFGVMRVIPAILLVGVILYFGVYPNVTSGYFSFVGTIVAVTYNIGDIIFVMMVVLLSYVSAQMKGGMLVPVWRWLQLGMICMLFADVLYIFFNAAYTEGVWSARLIDLFWMAAYFSVAVSFMEWVRVIKNVKEKVKGRLAIE